MNKLEALAAIKGLDGLWLIEERWGRMMSWKLTQLEEMDFDVAAMHPELQSQDLSQGRLDSVRDQFVTFIPSAGRAVVSINGVLAKETFPSENNFTYPEITAIMEELGNNREVEEIWLKIFSGGGQTAGVQSTGDMIFQVAQDKRVMAFGEDFLASAAYWLASQANEIVANESAFIGGIGTFGVLTDSTEHDAALGLKRIVITSGGVKGLGADGAITEEYITQLQRQVNELQDIFNKAIMRGRNMTLPEVQNLADGQMYIASAAVKLGLIERISSNHTLFEEANAPQPTGDIQMSQKNKVQNAPDKTLANNADDTTVAVISPINTVPVTADEVPISDAHSSQADGPNSLPTSEEWATYQRREKEAEAKRQVSDTRIAELEAREQKLAALTRQRTIAEAVESWQASGHLVKADELAISGFLTFLAGAEHPRIDVDGKSHEVYAYAISILNTVLTANERIVNFEELTRADASEDATATLNARQALIEYGVQLRPEIANV